MFVNNMQIRYMGYKLRHIFTKMLTIMLKNGWFLDFCGKNWPLFHVFRRHSTERSVGYLPVFITVGCGDQKTRNNGNMLSSAQQNTEYSLQTREKSLWKTLGGSVPPRVFHSDFSLVCREYLWICFAFQSGRSLVDFDTWSLVLCERTRGTGDTWFNLPFY